jgi:hypothetical protein
MSAAPQLFTTMLQTRPRVSPWLQLAVIHRATDGVLQATACKAAISYPYSAESDVDGWMPALLAECTGQATGMELLESMIRCGNVPPETPPEQFGAFLAASISRGLIYMDEWAPPALSKAV